MKNFFIFFIFILLLLESGCQKGKKKLYESRYQAAYEYINNCENLTFWKKDICDDKYKDLFPVNIVLNIKGGGDASGFKPLINHIFNPNRKSNLYVIFSRQYNNSCFAYCIQDESIVYSRNNTEPLVSTTFFGDLPEYDFSFTFIFNEDNSIKSVWHNLGGEY